MLRHFCRILDFWVWMHYGCTQSVHTSQVEANHVTHSTLPMQMTWNLFFFFSSNASKALGLLFTLQCFRRTQLGRNISNYSFHSTKKHILYYIYEGCCHEGLPIAPLTDQICALVYDRHEKVIQSHGLHLHCQMLYLFVLCQSTKQINCSRPSQCRPRDWAWYFAVKTNFIINNVSSNNELL